MLDRLRGSRGRADLGVLIRGFVAGDHHELQGSALPGPGERAHGTRHHATDELRASVGREREEALRHRVEIAREIEIEPHPAVLGAVTVVAVREERHAQRRRRPDARELVHDAPELVLRRFDQAVHATARVEAEREIDRARLRHAALDHRGGLQDSRLRAVVHHRPGSAQDHARTYHSLHRSHVRLSSSFGLRVFFGPVVGTAGSFVVLEQEAPAVDVEQHVAAQREQARATFARQPLDEERVLRATDLDDLVGHELRSSRDEA